MSEPTIDEMLSLMEDFDNQMSAKANENPAYYTAALEMLKVSKAIRAVLLHHKHNLVSVNQVIELEAVRAFVERVQARERDGRVWAAIWDELAEMEKEAEQK